MLDNNEVNIVDGEAGINLEAIFKKNNISIIPIKKKVIQFSRTTCFISINVNILDLTIDVNKKYINKCNIF